MDERADQSFRFMEELIATWLEGAHHTEISRVLDAIKAELRRRGLDSGAMSSRAPPPRRPPV